MGINWNTFSNNEKNEKYTQGISCTIPSHMNVYRILLFQKIKKLKIHNFERFSRLLVLLIHMNDLFLSPISVGHLHLNPNICLAPAFTPNICLTPVFKPNIYLTPAFKPSICLAPTFKPNICLTPAFKPSICLTLAFKPNIFLTPAFKPSTCLAPAFKPNVCLVPTFKPRICLAPTSKPNFHTGPQAQFHTSLQAQFQLALKPSFYTSSANPGSILVIVFILHNFFSHLYALFLFWTWTKLVFLSLFIIYCGNMKMLNFLIIF